MKSRSSLIIALTSVSLIALELVWTRIFSAEFFYTFAFLILSLAVLGLGLGALSLRLFGGQSHERDQLLGWALSLAGLASLVTPVLVFKLGLDFSQLFASFGMVLRLLAAVVLLSSAYFFGGIALAMLFKRNPRDIPRLYMADLLGAGGGVLAVILLMNHFGTPAATFFSAIPILVAALLASKGALKLVPIGLAGVVAVATFSPLAADLLEMERPERAPVIYKHWDAMAKIKVFDMAGHYRGLNIDNLANSPVIPFDGDFSNPELTEVGIDVSYLIRQFDSCRFLSLGAGGGSDVLHALVSGATEVHAVEVNPHINRMMVSGDPAGYLDQETVRKAYDDAVAKAAAAAPPATGEAGEGPPKPPEPPPPPVFHDEAGNIVSLASYSGHLYQDPRVRVISEDARTYIRRHKDRFDVIFSLSSNTWAALASGSFALAENYLFTTEAFKDYWGALTDDGFLSLEHQMYMPRLVSALVDALDQLGVADPTAHFAVYDLPAMRRNLLLVSKRPLTDEIRNNAYGELTPEKVEAIRLLYPAPEDDSDNRINRIVLDGWRAVAADSEIDVSPCTDNRPFVAQLGLWKNFSWEALRKANLFSDFRGFPLARSVIVLILLVVVLVILPLNLAPYLFRGARLRAVPWLYFFAIGMAFMIVEVVLIQKYTLFIGASVYSIAAVLLTLLVASGIGSRCSKRVDDRLAFAGIIACILLEVLLFGHLTSWLGALTLFPRILATAALIAPLGFFMGTPFPKGSTRVGELVDWAMAVNGAASVLGATAIMLIAFCWGFAVALLVGALLYLLAFWLFSLRPAW